MKNRKSTKLEKGIAASPRLSDDHIKALVDLQFEVENLQPLSAVEKAKFDQALAIDQLYYSSKLEGSELTESMIDTAIHGKKLPTA